MFVVDRIRKPDFLIVKSFQVPTFWFHHAVAHVCDGSSFARSIGQAKERTLSQQPNFSLASAQFVRVQLNPVLAQAI